MSEVVEYDAIAIGTGSAMNIVDAMLHWNPGLRVAVIDKDEPGGICLTRGCIPSKILLYSADLVRIIQDSNRFGVEAEIHDINFKKVMDRMRRMIGREIEMIREGLSAAPNIDYYHDVAEFIEPYELKVGGKVITSRLIFLCLGSKPFAPPINGLKETGFLTSDTVLKLERLPKRLGVIGGSYIGLEYGHFFSAMGSEVTVVEMMPRILPMEEPEISSVAEKVMGKYMNIFTNKRVVEVEKEGNSKLMVAEDLTSGERSVFEVDEVLVATGRAPNTDILKPEKGGIEVDSKGWIITNEYLETSQPGVYAFGDANGKYLFKHVANYESMVVYYNAVLNKRIKVDYHAVPHAVFTYPEIASVGLREKDAIKKYGEKNVLIGLARYEDTAKGEAMGVKDYFVKVILRKDSREILGAHIIGPYASILIQEIVNLMYTSDKTYTPILRGMHIHPALSEVVERAFFNLMEPSQYHHVIREHFHWI